MKKEKLRRKPCAKCPYTLGLVKTVTNPCPECKLNGYQSYEWFVKMQSQGKEPENKGRQGRTQDRSLFRMEE